MEPWRQGGSLPDSWPYPTYQTVSSFPIWDSKAIHFELQKLQTNANFFLIMIQNGSSSVIRWTVQLDTQWMAKRMAVENDFLNCLFWLAKINALSSRRSQSSSSIPENTARYTNALQDQLRRSDYEIQVKNRKHTAPRRQKPNDIRIRM